MQNLHYTYDPAGNITRIRDDAQQAIYFRNKRVEPNNEYTYDATYRLIEATGREHLGQVGGSPIPHSYNDAARVGRPHTGDGNAMAAYCECYEYDAVGNIMEMIHRVACPGAESWRRSYTYAETSQLDPGKHSNRLTSTTIAGALEPYSVAGDGYDAHGNMLQMPHLSDMKWDFNDQLRMTQRQKVNAADAEGAARDGERTFYVYDSAGERVRKVTVKANGDLKDERVYLGGFEVFRCHSGANAGLVRETLHIMDSERRIALVESRTDTPAPSETLIRYQFGNHLGSASLELNGQGKIISYEEYTPYLTGPFADTNGVVEYATLKTAFDGWYWAMRVAALCSKWKLTLVEWERLFALAANVQLPVEAQLLDFGKLPLDSTKSMVPIDRLLQTTRLRQFDYSTITDAVLHIKYTAREDAGALKNSAIDHLRNYFSEDGTTRSWLALDLRRDFGDAWSQFLHPVNPAAGNMFEFTMSADLFPQRDSDKVVKVNKIHLLARFASAKSKETYVATLTPPLPAPPPDGVDTVNLTGGSAAYGGLHFGQWPQKEGEGAAPPEIVIDLTAPPSKWNIKITPPGGGNLVEDQDEGGMEVKDLILVLGYEWQADWES